MEKQATLFDDIQDNEIDKERSFILDQIIKLPLEQVEFRYGSFAFRFTIKDLKKELEFEIENCDIRPEFEILKPYFSKLLNLCYVNISISAEFVNEKIVAQLAHSEDLERINREVIESVKFKFVTKTYFGKTDKKDFSDNLLDLDQLQSGEDNRKVFESEEELIQSILKNQNLKHYRQIKYLANAHSSDILKIRFVLNPFSFVFLLPGTEQFHIVMETLDTEEATYIWHIEKELSLLKSKLREIDQSINAIRNSGRQAFLESIPQNFTRILHDYTDDRKGFIIWKDFLEEKLV